MNNIKREQGVAFHVPWDNGQSCDVWVFVNKTQAIIVEGYINKYGGNFTFDSGVSNNDFYGAHLPEDCVGDDMDDYDGIEFE
jgi:hypothetical protein